MYKYNRLDSTLFDKIIDCYNEVVKIGNTFEDDGEFQALMISAATALLDKGNWQRKCQEGGNHE